HPKELGDAEVVSFLSHLASDRTVAASTRNQALNALVFMYKYVLECPLGELPNLVRSKRPINLPVVLTPGEVSRLLKQLQGNNWLAACLMYGSGLRLMEAVRLRIKDIEFDYLAIVVRDGKGKKDRIVTLAKELVEPLKRHLQSVCNTYKKDLKDGLAGVYLPNALERKYPNAGLEWGWRYIFHAPRVSIDPRTGIERRHHLGEQNIQRAVKKAVRASNITKPASCHMLTTQFCDPPAGTRCRPASANHPGREWGLAPE
ncbi:MAG TPA: integron integrase, partial [Gammaproteobacteria bacterium]|nr:integron integrase [Gammaproteobacteria bacterium]